MPHMCVSGGPIIDAASLVISRLVIHCASEGVMSIHGIIATSMNKFLYVSNLAEGVQETGAVYVRNLGTSTTSVELAPLITV